VSTSKRYVCYCSDLEILELLAFLPDSKIGVDAFKHSFGSARWRL